MSRKAAIAVTAASITLVGIIAIVLAIVLSLDNTFSNDRIAQGIFIAMFLLIAAMGTMLFLKTYREAKDENPEWWQRR